MRCRVTMMRAPWGARIAFGDEGVTRYRRTLRTSLTRFPQDIVDTLETLAIRWGGFRKGVETAPLGNGAQVVISLVARATGLEGTTHGTEHYGRNGAVAVGCDH